MVTLLLVGRRPLPMILSPLMIHDSSPIACRQLSIVWNSRLVRANHRIAMTSVDTDSAHHWILLIDAFFFDGIFTRANAA
jgi:hypothetical protein